MVSPSSVLKNLMRWKVQDIFTGEVILACNADCLVSINWTILLDEALLIPYP
jgi:hypothetical protein